MSMAETMKHGMEKRTPFRKLTEAEIQYRRERGLCYSCDEKFSAGHRCKKKDLQVMILQELEEEVMEDSDDGKCEKQEEEVSVVAQIVEVSLNSVVGLTLPKTIKIAGSIGEQPVVVLIDGVATHNFISTTVVQKLHLPLSPTAKYGVQLGTGAILPREGICKRVRLTLQGIEIVEDFLPLELGSTDVILGVQWLETLGGTYTNWKTHVMKFRVGNEMVVLQGYPSLHKTLVSLKAMMRTIKRDMVGSCGVGQYHNGRVTTEGGHDSNGGECFDDVRGCFCHASRVTTKKGKRACHNSE
ncbi:uncharacterized protein [Aristolochia californica]|uniref:uncharacterized protein n=1 Tax=Aristolochia californica TaxID=171875 RepID=UPI0035E2E5DD